MALDTRELQSILDKLPRAQALVVGDLCLDAYWVLAEDRSERSVETGLRVRKVRQQRWSLGGAGNVAANLKALGVGRVAVAGVAGDDPFGREMLRLFVRQGIDVGAVLTPSEGWDTHVYAKPIRAGREQSRLDFGAFNDLSDATAEALLARLAIELPAVDAVAINQQLPRGIHGSATFRCGLARALEALPTKPVVLDARSAALQYPGVMVKANLEEAARRLGSVEGANAAATALAAQAGKPAFVSAGERGVAVAADGTHWVPGVPCEEADPVGAGDALLAGIVAGLAVGVSAEAAAELGVLAAAVTARKRGQTGTATPSEIMALHRDR